jgi:phage/plasmid-associated DNA primase
MSEKNFSLELHSNEVAIAPVFVCELSDPPNPDIIGETIDWLLSIGLPPLPECPIDADRFGKEPKSPHYMTRSGEPYSVSWKPWQKKLPPQQLIDKWFLIPRGIGTLGSVSNRGHFITWVDFDAKNFDGNCNEVVGEWEEKFPILQFAPMFRSPSGGYRFMIALSKEPENFKANSGFVLTSDPEQPCGEVLCRNGGHTLLPPTVGLNGAYVWVRWSEYPPIIEKLEDIGIQPKLTKKVDKPKPTINNSHSQNFSSNSDLSDVINQVISKLDFETAFNWEGHNFQYENADKVKGCCPWHDSTSGTAFYAERKGNTYLWRCAGCSIGGDVIGYRSYLNNGDIKPRGKEFINTLKELCNETGVAFPEKGTPQTTSSYDNYQPKVAVDDDPNRMKTTPDATVLHALFEGGKGNFKTMNDAYYKYEGKGYWQHLQDAKVNKLICDKLLEIYQLKTSNDSPTKEFKYGNDKNKSSAFKFCRSVLLVEDEPFNDHLLCFLNGTADLRTGEMIPHSREHFLTYAIASNYVPNAECPEVFKNFVIDAFGEEFLPLIRAITAMYLDPTAPFGYFAHVMGSSGSGKGTLIRLWGSMFGENNLRSLTSFGDITTAEGRHQHLTGTKFVSFPDMGGYQGSLKAFYELVDNGSMTGRALYSSSSYERRWHCRFALASVDYLSIENSGDGWDRRCIPLPTRQRRGAIDPDLGRKLQEVKGEIISWALGMNRQKRDCLIMNASAASDRIASLKREQSIYSDSTKAFVDLCLRPSNARGAFIENHKLYDWYCAFCKTHGFKAQSSTKFISHLRGVLPHNNVPRRQYREGGKIRNVPAHFTYLTQINGAFVSTNLLNETLWQCNKALCTDGGLDEFDEFWLAVTGVTATDLQPCDAPVTAESITNNGFEGLSQASQASQGETDIKFAEIFQEDSISSGNDDEIGLNEIDIRVSRSILPCDGCDTKNNIDTVSISAVTQAKNQLCDNPVTAVTPVTASQKSSTPEQKMLDEAVEAVEIMLEATEPSWEAIKEALDYCGIRSYTQLEDKLTLGDYKKLDELADANGECEIAF